MDQEIGNSKKSTDRMSIQDFQSKNSSFQKYKGDNEQLLNYSNKSAMSIENYEGTNELLKKLSGSDSGKMQIERSIKSSSTNNKSDMLGRSDEGLDKSKLGLLRLTLQQNNEDFLNFEVINHECECLKYKKTDYCPMYCSCYNAPQKCSQKKCCKGCFQSKQKLWPEILKKNQNKTITSKNNQRPTGLNTKKVHDQDVSIYIDGGKKQPKKFREQRCECRNSKCQNKYCVCFTAGNKCSIKCMCENCRNSDFNEKSNSSISSKSKNNQPYLQRSTQSLDKDIQFESFDYKP